MTNYQYFIFSFLLFSLPFKAGRAQSNKLIEKPAQGYIRIGKTIDTSIRRIQIKNYKNDTLIAYFDYCWNSCVPQIATYYTCAIKQGNYYQCFDYYSKNNQLYRRGFFLDKKLSMPISGFKVFYQNGRSERTGYFKDGKKTGKWKNYDANGNLTDSSEYKDNYRIGAFFQIVGEDTLKGNLDSIGRGKIYITKKGGKRLYKGYYGLYGQEDSIWIGYDDKGRIWYSDLCDLGKTIKSTCFDTAGNPLSDCISRIATFGKGKNSVGKYLRSHIHFPTYLQLTIPNGRVIVGFSVDTNGKTGDIIILQSLQKDFDNNVINTIKHMPRWKPEIYHNRPVKSYYIEPVNFTNG